LVIPQPEAIQPMPEQKVRQQPSINGKVCPQCGAIVDEGRYYCDSCGAYVMRSPARRMGSSPKNTDYLGSRQRHNVMRENSQPIISRSGSANKKFIGKKSRSKLGLVFISLGVFLILLIAAVFMLHL
jgi:uncharacterized membrane protein YvbJ